MSLRLDIVGGAYEAVYYRVVHETIIYRNQSHLEMTLPATDTAMRGTEAEEPSTRLICDNQTRASFLFRVHVMQTPEAALGARVVDSLASHAREL